MDGEEAGFGGAGGGMVSEQRIDTGFEGKGKEVEADIQGDIHDDDDIEDEDDEEEEEEECGFTFKTGVNPLDFVGDDGSGVQLYQQFERLEYEALAEKKRKAIDDGSQSVRLAKKPRQDDIPEAVMDEIMDAMNGGRRRRRKSKKRGRTKGIRNKLSPEIRSMLGAATLHYALGRNKEAVSVLNEVVRLAPNLPDSYDMLGLVHKAMGNEKVAFEFYMLAGLLKPKDSSLWRMLLSWSIEQGNISQTFYCLSKAITADPEDVDLRFCQASLYVDHGHDKKAAESYEHILRVAPGNVEALMSGAKLYLKRGEVERAIGILEDHLKSQPCEVDLGVFDLLLAMLMKINAYERALKQIDCAQTVYYSGKELPLKLKTKAGICHLYLRDMEKAEILYDVLQVGSPHEHADLITEIADSFMSLGYSNSALKFYHQLEIEDGDNRANLLLKIAHCYLSLKERVKAKEYFYKGLHGMEGDIEARLTLATLLLEDGKEDEALTLLSPKNLDSDDYNLNSEISNQWWFDPKIKLKLCQIYRAKGMTKEFVDTLLPLVRESFRYLRGGHKENEKKRLTIRVLKERIKKVDSLHSDGVIRGSAPLVNPSDRLKASRAKKSLKQMTALKEEKKAAAKAAGLDWISDDENAEPEEKEEEVPKGAPLPNLLIDEEHRRLIIDLCKALASLQRYHEALEIIQNTLQLSQNTLLPENEEFQSLGAQMSFSTMDPKHVYKYVIDNPHSYGAWNCYYKVILRLGKIYGKKWPHKVRVKPQDSVPAILISGHEFTVRSGHQNAARKYLEAYKLLPENPLVNLCAGTALINLSLGYRLQNIHQTIAQGLSFLYNNLRLCDSSQEALYNIARACHHVGLVTLAASYYQKVLETSEKDLPVPELLSENWEASKNAKRCSCDLRREAAFNLHLIYKKSGAVDLARQILKDHCTI